MNDCEARCERLETKLAYLEDFMTKLQEIAVEHTSSIDRLKAENRALQAKLGEIEDAVQDTASSRPPHY